MLHSLRFQSARIAQRSAFAYADVITIAGPSQHPWGAHRSVSYAVVWGGVQINQLFVSSSDWFLADFLLQQVVNKRYLNSLAIFTF